MQAKYTDLLLLNKHELASDRQLDDVLDSLYELNTETPKIKVSRESPPSPDLIFGLLSVPSSSSSSAGVVQTKESNVFSQVDAEQLYRSEALLANGNGREDHNEEVETKNIWKGGEKPGHSHSHAHNHGEHTSENAKEDVSLDKEKLDSLLNAISSEEIYRIKGFILLPSSSPSTADGNDEKQQTYHILNWAFGRYDMHEASAELTERLRKEGVQVRLTVMGARGEVVSKTRAFADALGAALA